MKTEKRNCENCKFLRRHYYIEDGILSYAHRGFCRCGRIPPREMKKIPHIVDCPHWQPEEEKTKSFDFETVISHIKKELDLLLTLK